MGKAIIVPNADYSMVGLGKVTIAEKVPLQTLSISGESSVIGIEAEYSVSYIPSNTNQRDVIWSIESGGDYASIDSSTGKLTIKSGANNSDVTIKVTSLNNNSIFATKTINVTYYAVIEVNSISIVGDELVVNTSTYEVSYSPSDTTQKGVTWSIESGSEYASIEPSTGVLTVINGAKNSSVTIKAVSTINSQISNTKTIIVSKVADKVEGLAWFGGRALTYESGKPSSYSNSQRGVLVQDSSYVNRQTIWGASGIPNYSLIEVTDFNNVEVKCLTNIIDVGLSVYADETRVLDNGWVNMVDKILNITEYRKNYPNKSIYIGIVARPRNNSGNIPSSITTDSFDIICS